MVVRQVVTGVGGGAVLAFLALFLTIPRSMVEEEAPAWLSGLLPEEEKETSLSGAEAEQERLIDEADGEELQKLSAQPEVVLDAEHEGMLVASLGAGPGAEIHEPEILDESLDEEPVIVPQADELAADLYLGALSKQTIIRSRPDPKARIVGFARTGALLRRAAIAAGHQGCKGGWYRVEPDGYVCVGKAATLDSEHAIIRLASVQPDRSLAMPYAYGQSRYPTPPLYTKIPTEKQQQIAEQDLRGHRRKNFESLWSDSADTPPPSLLLDGARIPRPYGYPVLERSFMTGRAVGSSAFAFIDMFESGGRKWGLTTDLSLLPLDRLTPVESSEFFGEVLRGAEDLPLAFVRTQRAHLYAGAFEEGELRPSRAIAYRESFQLSGREKKLHGQIYLETIDGEFLKKSERVIVIEARESLPKWAKNDRSWIEVSILNQTLVAYRGATPVFATLVSTGKDGLGDPETTHSTARGLFLIHTKHVTSTMSGDAADDEFDLRDVPYVQYFHGGFAFHAAFWHDGFGQPRSHGCVNLSPQDARHLFSLTDPPVPARWHSALSREGTLVYIHP